MAPTPVLLYLCDTGGCGSQEELPNWGKIPHSSNTHSNRPTARNRPPKIPYRETLLVFHPLTQGSMGGWKQPTSLLRSSCSIKKANSKPSGTTTGDCMTSEKTNVRQNLSSDTLWRQSRERVLQTPHLLLLNFGNFKIQILCSKGRERESTSIRNFLRRCISFGSHFHPGHPNISMPCCSLPPEGWSCSASLQGGGPPTTDTFQPVCSHHHRHVQFCLLFDGHFCNCWRHLWLVFELQSKTRMIDTKKWHWPGKPCLTAGLQDFQTDCNIALECFHWAVKLRHGEDKNSISTIKNDGRKSFFS